jgi:hypothetical protein
VRAFAVAAAFALIPALLHGEARAEDVPAAAAPPMAPFKRGLLVEGNVGVYAPTGTIKNLVAPGPMMRVALGWDFNKWFGVFAAGDVAFLSTGRAPPPPGDRAFLLWGLGGGARVSLGITERVRIPLRLEIAMRRVEDGGVLAVYGYNTAKDLSFGYGGTLGLEWRASSRHFGVLAEAGVRNDTGLEFPGKSQPALAIVGTLGVHYTL